jgi:hypothetical protein
MMLSRFAQQAVKRALPVRAVNFAAFSSVPGYGKGKTSTGIVSSVGLLIIISLGGITSNLI